MIKSTIKFSVNIDGIPSKCSANCNYEWLSSLTPIVSSIDTSECKSNFIFKNQIINLLNSQSKFN